MNCQSLDNSLFDWNNAYSSRISHFPIIWYSRVGPLDNQIRYSDVLKKKNGDLHGAAFAKDAKLSQEKAKSELIERCAYIHFFENNGIKAGLELDNSSTGFAALPKRFGEEAVRVGAMSESIERWILNLIFYRQNIKLKRKTHWGKKESYHACVNFKNKKYYFCLVIKKYKNGFLSGASVSLNKRNSFESASYELLNHWHKVKRWESLDEKLNTENLLELRAQNYYQNEILAKKYLEKLSNCTKNTYKLPEVIFDKALRGSWDTDYFVHRILLSDSEPIYEGGSNKMML